MSIIDLAEFDSRVNSLIADALAGISPGGAPASMPFCFVGDFGAIGDGITDDSAAFQEAVESAALAGGKVIVPFTTNGYYIGATIENPGNVKIVGLGRPKLISGDNSLFTITGSQCGFEEFRINMAAATAGNAAFMFDNSTHGLERIRIKGIELDQYQCAITDKATIYPIIDLHVEDFICFRSKGTAFNLRNFWAFIFFKHVVVDQTRNTTAVTYPGIYMEANQGAKFTDVDILGGNQATAATAHGLVINNSEAVWLTRVFGDTLGGHAISVSNSNYIRVLSLTSSLCYYGGIIFNNCQNVSGEDVFVNGRKGISGAPAANGLTIQSSHHTKLDNVKAQKCTGTGIYVLNTTSARLMNGYVYDNQNRGLTEAGTTNYCTYTLDFNQNAVGNLQLTGAGSVALNCRLSSGALTSTVAGPTSL